MLEIDHIEYRYPESDVCLAFNLRLAEGSLVVVEGQSGAGKSTLLSLIAGFLDPDKGDIRFQGQSLTGLKPAERPVSMLFQQDNLFDHLDVWTNVALGVSPSLRLTDEQRRIIKDGLADLGIGGMEDRAIPTLSGGQQQRVALARALVRSRIGGESGLRRPLLLLDEPFSALDADTKSDCLDLVKRLVEDFGLTAMLVSHDPQDARRLRADVFRLKAMG